MSKINRSKIVLFSSLTTAAVTAAVLVPVLQSQYGLSRMDQDLSFSQEGNRNRILNFINDSNKINQSILSGQLQVDETKHSYADRSFITVSEAYDQNWFEFKTSGSLKYNLYKDDLSAELAYVKASITNSTYPVVGLRIYAGQGDTYSEVIYEYSESSLSGFKQTGEELIINNIVDDINKNPKKYFKLKEEVGKFGDLGLYAKNIKTEDFDFIDNKLIKDLKENFYFIELTGLEVDNVVPSNLILTYDVIFDNGITQFKKTYNKVTINGIDIEFGVDDPKSKVKNFIKENKESLLADLYQYFEFDDPNSSEDKPDETKPSTFADESVKMDMKEAYKQNLIKFNPKNDNIYTITNAGLFLEFRTYQQQVTRAKQDAADPVATPEQSVFPNPFDSTTPMYRLYLTSYRGTPKEYTESFVIEGTKQEGKFKVSETQTKMEKIDALLDELNLNVDDFITLEKVELEGPLKNKTQKAGQGTTTQSTDIPFVILKNAYDKYKEDSTKYDIPFNFDLKLNDSAFNQIQSKDKKEELKTELQKVIEQINKLTIEDKLEGIEINQGQQDFYQFKVNIVLGEKNKDLFISTQNYALVNVDQSQFKQESVYYKDQVDKVVAFLNGTSSSTPPGTPFAPAAPPTTSPSTKPNKDSIKINIVTDDSGQKITEANAVEFMKQAQWDKIFSSVTILNLPDGIIEYPDFDTPVKVDIDFPDLARKDYQEIEQIIKAKKITIKLLVSKNSQPQSISVEFEFSELFD